MKVLIFTLLALAVSAHDYGYSSYPSYSSYSSYPSSYGSAYGSGYGSSLYGSSYGSGLNYGLGGIGQSYYGGNVGGYTSYKPSVYQTARYSYTYPYGNAEAYKTGSYGHSTSEGPEKIVYIQDFSGIEGHSGYQQDTPVIAGAEKYIISPIHTSALGSRAGSWHRADSHKEAVTGDLSRVQFAQEVAGIGAQDFESTALVGTGYEGTKGASVPKVPTGSFVESGVIGKSGAHGSSTTGGGHSQVSSTKDFSKTTAHNGGAAAKTPTHSFDRISPQRTVASAPKVPTGSFGGSGFGDKRGGQRTGNAAGHSQVSFVQDFSKTTGQSHEFEVKPEIQRTVPVSGGIASQQTSGQNFGATHKTGTQGIRQAGEVSFIQGHKAVSGHSGHRVVGQKPAVTFFDKPTTGGVSSAKQSSGYAHRAGSVYKTGTHGFPTGAGPQISFILGGTELYQRGGYRPASIDKMTVPAFPYVRKHSSGYVHRTDSSVGAGPQISFTRGQVAQRQPVLKPVAAFAPKQSSGYQRVVGAVPKNTAAGFSTASGLSRISFIQDFSKVSGHQVDAIKPNIPTIDEFRVPAFPGAIASQGYQSRYINKASFASKSTQNPSESIKAPKQPAVPQAAFTEFDRQSPAHASYYGSAEGLTTGDKSIFIEEPATGFADGYAVDYKNNVASVEGITGDKLSSFVVVPETTFTNDKSSVLKYSSADEGAVTGGIQHSSAVFRGTGDAETSYKVSSEDHSGDKSKLYVAVPADDYDDEKSSIFLHSSGVAPTGTFVEERGSFFQLSPGSADTGVAAHEKYESQIPVL